MAKIIVIDGQRGVVKTGILESFEKQLVAADLKVARDSLELIDFMLASERLQRLKAKAKKTSVLILDTKHVLSLTHNFYNTKELDDYKVLNRALGIVKAVLEPTAVILVDSFPASSKSAKTRRGYLWEAKQRGYHVVARLSDAETIFNELIKTLAPRKKAKSEAVPLKDVLRSRKSKIESKKKRDK